MFAHRFFGSAFFGPRYFGGVGQNPPVSVGIVQMVGALQRIGDSR